MVTKPLRLTVCGLPGTLSGMVSVPLWGPEDVGAKLTETLQVEGEPGGGLSVMPEQPSLCIVNCPEVVIAPMTRGESPLLVKVMVCGVLVVFNP